MSFRGHVKNGVVIPDHAGDINLPDGAEVIVDLVPIVDEVPLVDEIIKFSGLLPPDLDVKASYVQHQLEKHR